MKAVWWSCSECGTMRATFTSKRQPLCENTSCRRFWVPLLPQEQLVFEGSEWWGC